MQIKAPLCTFYRLSANPASHQKLQLAVNSFVKFSSYSIRNDLFISSGNRRKIPKKEEAGNK